jgi:heme oxygenase (mycobilin-producing)
MKGRVRVVIWYRCPGGTDEIVGIFGRIAGRLNGTPGLLNSELLQSYGESDSVAVMSEWESLEAFRTWESGANHRGTTAPLRMYQDRRRDRPFEIYEVAAATALQPT